MTRQILMFLAISLCFTGIHSLRRVEDPFRYVNNQEVQKIDRILDDMERKDGFVGTLIVTSTREAFLQTIGLQRSISTYTMEAFTDDLMRYYFPREFDRSFIVAFCIEERLFRVHTGSVVRRSLPDSVVMGIYDEVKYLLRDGNYSKATYKYIKNLDKRVGSYGYNHSNRRRDHDRSYSNDFGDFSGIFENVGNFLIVAGIICVLVCVFSCCGDSSKGSSSSRTAYRSTGNRREEPVRQTRDYNSAPVADSSSARYRGNSTGGGTASWDDKNTSNTNRNTGGGTASWDDKNESEDSNNQTGGGTAGW